MVSIYSSRFAYHLAMRLLYGRHFESRYRAIAARIPEGATVVDLCAGDAYLYLRHLRRKRVRYHGFDLAPALVRWARRHGADVEIADVRSAPIPSADYAVLQASLYQFLPAPRGLLDRLVAAARTAAIVAEPVQNLAASDRQWLKRASGRLTVPPGFAGPCERRFDPPSLEALVRSHPAFEMLEIVPGGRELLVVFRGGAPS